VPLEKPLSAQNVSASLADWAMDELLTRIVGKDERGG
jgi:hypothetical protein